MKIDRINIGGIMEQAKIIANLLKVLSNDNRLLIVCKLLERELTVTEIQEQLSHISQAAISQHLSVLKANQLVDCKKNGMYITYFISDQRLVQVIEVLKTNYCTKL